MFQILVSHNDDLRRLVEKGYAVAFDSNYLIVRDIPYLDEQHQLKWGAMLAKLEFVDNYPDTGGLHHVQVRLPSSPWLFALCFELEAAY